MAKLVQCLYILFPANCGKPTHPANRERVYLRGQKVNGRYAVGTTLYYRCVIGDIIGIVLPATVCQANGRWTYVEETCEGNTDSNSDCALSKTKIKKKPM